MLNRTSITRMRLAVLFLIPSVLMLVPGEMQRYAGPGGRIRIALAKQPFSPNGLSKGPSIMAEGGIQKILADMGADVRVEEARLTLTRRRSTAGGSGWAWRSGTSPTS